MLPMLVKIKAKIICILLMLKILIKMIKANIPVKMGTQMIKMIKLFLLALMRRSKPVMNKEWLEI